MKLRLNNCPNFPPRIGREISCENNLGYVIAGGDVTCNFPESDFTFSDGSVNFALANGSKQSVKLISEINFTVPENLARTTFNLSGTSEDGTTCLSGEHNARYPDYDEFMKNKEVFIQLIGTLIGFILVVMYYGVVSLMPKYYNKPSLKKSAKNFNKELHYERKL